MPPDDAPIDLLDLKLLPAWVKETPETKAYADFEGETAERGSAARTDRGRLTGRGPRRFSPADGRRDDRGQRRGHRPTGQRRGKGQSPEFRDRSQRSQGASQRGAERPPLQLTIRFLPSPAAFDSVAAQIRAELLAYSVFSLARLFLQKPERYNVQLAGTAQQPLYQLGEHGVISIDRHFLENNAFRFAQQDFYTIETSQKDPIKGNFSSVARHRLSGTVLGPTNYHDYQRKLRGLYEQRFSRRLSFPDFQKQIEIVNDPVLVEEWKEEARNVTSYRTLQAVPAQTFSGATEAEKHFRQHHLGNLIRAIDQTTVDGPASRNLPDRVLRGEIETAWTAQMRSPSQMMAELSNRLRETGLHIFRHRKGMLFVSPVRVRPFAHDQASVSAQIRAIVEMISASPQITRKDLAETLLAGIPAEETEARKLSLASDLRWLISEGYLIEFNDGSLDLPRGKGKTVEAKTAGTEIAGTADLKAAESDRETIDHSLTDSGRDAIAAAPPPFVDSSLRDASARQATEYATATESNAKPASASSEEPNDSRPTGEEEELEIGGS